MLYNSYFFSQYLKELGGLFSGVLELDAPNRDLVASLGVFGLLVTTVCKRLLLRDSLASSIIRELVNFSAWGR